MDLKEPISSGDDVSSGQLLISRYASEVRLPIKSLVVAKKEKS